LNGPRFQSCPLNTHVFPDDLHVVDFMPFDLNIRGIGPASVYWSDAASVKKRCTAEFNIKVSLTVKNMILQIRKLF